MKALSIQQPWSWLIVNGFKDIENRSWSTSYRGPVLIHAGKKIAKLSEYERQAISMKIEGDIPDELPTGGVVGIAEIVDSVRFSSSFWFSGEYGFVLANARPLPFYPCKGQLGFFDVPGYELNTTPQKKGD